MKQYAAPFPKPRFLSAEKNLDPYSGRTLFRKTGDDLSPTITFVGEGADSQCAELVEQYDELLREKRLSWTTHLRLMRKLGAGGQGVVYLTERRGSDDFTLPVALKVFSPERYATINHYDADMLRMGRVAAKVARIQHENLLGVENFLVRDRIRMMVMEWVEGYDLRCLLTPRKFGIIKERVSKKRWERINELLITRGPVQPRFRAGAAISIARDCLEAIAALHRQGIVHGDVKPANIMLKRSGHAKMIDIGSAFDLEDLPSRRACTPAYAAPEVLEGKSCTPRSDLASLGYVVVELISGRTPFAEIDNLPELLIAKRELPARLPELMPDEIADDEILLNFCRLLIEPDPEKRFPTAEDAELQNNIGAVAFHRQLVKNDLDREYENDIRIWIEELLEIDEFNID